MTELEELKKLKAEYETADSNHSVALDIVDGVAQANNASEVAKNAASNGFKVASTALEVAHNALMGAIDKSTIMLAINNYAWRADHGMVAVDRFELNRRRSAAFKSI